MPPSTRACRRPKRRACCTSSARSRSQCRRPSSGPSSRPRTANGRHSPRPPASGPIERKGNPMAKIVFAAGTSHTPMLLASDETLPRFQETDRNIKHRDKEGRPVTYGDLLEKADPKLAHMVAPENLVARQNVARTAAAHLRKAIAGAKLDALIVMGDDQNESYLEDSRPAFAVYFAATIRNAATQHQTYSHYPDWYVKNRQGFFEADQPRDYPVHAGLATHLIETLMDIGFDVASSKCLPEHDGEGHAIAYVHRHVLDPADPVPVVPIFLNTYFPPNQPRPKRCYQLGP